MTSEDSFKVAWQEQLELNAKFTRMVDEAKQEAEKLRDKLEQAEKRCSEWEALAARYEVGVSQWKEYAEACKVNASQWEECANRSAQHVDTLTAEKEALQRDIEEQQRAAARVQSLCMMECHRGLTTAEHASGAWPFEEVEALKREVEELRREKEELQREVEALRSSHLPDTLLVDVEIPGVVGEVVEGMRERDSILADDDAISVHQPLQLAGKPEAIREFRKRILRGAISTLCWIEQMDRAVKS